VGASHQIPMITIHIYTYFMLIIGPLTLWLPLSHIRLYLPVDDIVHLYGHEKSDKTSKTKFSTWKGIEGVIMKKLCNFFKLKIFSIFLFYY